MNTKKNCSADFFVAQIHARKLFGHFDYDLDFTCGEDTNASRLALLYGDNGSGKTTLLEMSAKGLVFEVE